MKKIVINACFGGFSLSSFAMEKYCEAIKKDLFFYTQTKYKHSDGVDEFIRVDATDEMFHFHTHNDLGASVDSLEDADWFEDREIPRDDSILIDIVEKYGSEKTSGSGAELKIVEIPDDIEWVIEEYDGAEHVAEKHNTWS